MNATEVAQRYLNAWNRHDADAIVAAFAEGGTYHNPNMDQPLSGEAIATFAKRVWVGYPDFSVELVSMGETGGGLGRLSMGWCVAPTPGRD
jgi:DNA-binding transcriptional regulator YbjK